MKGLNVSRGGGEHGADAAWIGGAGSEATTAGSGGVLGSGGALTTADTGSGGAPRTPSSVIDSGGAPAAGGTTRNTAPDPIGGTTAAEGGTLGSGGIKGSGGVILVGGSPGSGGASGGGLGGTGGARPLGGTGGDGTGGTGGVQGSGGTSTRGGDASAGGTSGCVFGQFQAPDLITGLGLGERDSLWAPSLSSDGKTLYFAASGAVAPENLYVATRSDRGSAFSRAVALDSINTPASAEGTPCISYDGLTLYFYSDRAGGSGGRDIWFASRTTAQGGFGTAKPLPAVNQSTNDHLPWVSADELTLLFSVGTGDFSDIYIASRASRAADFSSPAPLAAVNTAATREDRAALSSDGLTIYFTSNRPGGLGQRDTWVGTRSRSDSSFASFTDLEVANSTADDMDVTLSRDETELLFVSDRTGAPALYRSVRNCR